MLEKEIKILEINVEKIQKKLEELWAVKTFEWYIHDIYYDFLDEYNNNHKLETKDRLFRVRQKWNVHLYTIKRKIKKKAEWAEKWFKIAEEWESIITDVKSFKRVLEKYWMKETREKKKHRISYKLDSCEFDIDNYYICEDTNYPWICEKSIPALLEIEASTTKEINKWIKKLDLEKHQKEKWWSRKLFKHYWVEYGWLY